MRRIAGWDQVLRGAVSGVLLAVALAAGGTCCFAQSAADADLAHPQQIISAQRDGYTISALANHLEGITEFKQAVLLFPGSPGIMRLRMEDGRIQFAQAGNFLVRSRRHWLDQETLVLVMDAPSNQWATFSQQFRATPQYGADIAALMQEAAKRFKIAQWIFVGTSEGSVSAFHAARMNPAVARVILSASLFLPTRNGPGLSGVEWSELKSPLLWVHHENDPCHYTAYRDARRHAEKTQSPLVTVRGGGPGRGEACQAFTAHGFAGIERETVLAMRTWVKTGTVPLDVER